MTSVRTNDTQIIVDEHVPLVRIIREFDAPPDRVFAAHTDPAAVRPLWAALGATVDDREDGGFEVRWPSSPMVVRVAPGERSGPVGLVVPDLAPGERTDVAPVLLGV